MKRIFAILIIASTLCSLEANGQLTVGEFLLSAINDPEVQTFTQQISYLDT